MLYDIDRHEWSDELCELFGVPMSMLPEVRAVERRLRRRARAMRSARRSPFWASPAISRRRCSVRGAGRPGPARTPTAPARFCCSTPANDASARRSGGLLTTIACDATGRAGVRARGGDLHRRRRGAMAARRTRHHRRTRARPRRWRARSSRPDGVYFVPALTGLGAPDWEPNARGTIVGLTRGSGARTSRARRSRRWRTAPRTYSTA